MLAAPILYYALTDLRVAGFQPPEAYTADLLNLVIPTHLEAVGAGWAHSIARHFPGNSTEQGALIGLPLLAIDRALRPLGLADPARALPPRRAGARGLRLTRPEALGRTATAPIPLPTLLGHNSISLPGLRHHFLPLFDNILPVRFALYASLAGAVIAALWMASTRSGVAALAPPGARRAAARPEPGRRRLDDDLLGAGVLHERRATDRA